MVENAKDAEAPSPEALVNGTPKPSNGSDSEFHPVEIPGEPLSATILRERR